MKTVHKFSFSNPGRFGEFKELEFPEGAEIIRVARQRELVCFWAVVDPTVKEFRKRAIGIFGTGWEIPPGQMQYLGTFTEQSHMGELVWHAFERIDLGNSHAIPGYMSCGEY